VIHYIISLHSRHPNISILVGKLDIKAAYQRVSLHGDIAEKCSIMLKDFALLSLRLMFGGSPCPHEFCLFSELCADLANDLLRCNDGILCLWDHPILKNS